MANLPVRPDTAPPDPEARGTNKFKQALNTFMYGTSDPSYVDVGAVKAQGAQQFWTGMGQMASAVARPEVAGAIMQSYANQGVQAAQAMRERYYQKEHTQMMELQITPEKQRLDQAQMAYRERTKIVNMPIPRTVSYEEAQARSIDAQMATPTSPEQIQTGTTAEGKPKTQLMDGVPSPEPNPAAGAGVMSAVEYSAETMAFMDPVTGQPVPILSARGRDIEREAMDDFGATHNEVLTNMMDAFAQYPGNPFAVNSMQKIMDNVINHAGKAVTGQSAGQSQTEWWQAYQEKQADIAKKTSDANQAALDYENDISTMRAGASDTIQMAMNNDDVFKRLSKRQQKLVKSGADIEQYSEKDIMELNGVGRMMRDLQEKELAQRKQAGLVRISPVELGKPELWHRGLRNKEDSGYRKNLAQRYNELVGGLASNLGQFARLNPDARAKLSARYGIPPDVADKLALGMTSDPSVVSWIDTKVKSSGEYKDAQTHAYMDSIGTIWQQQPEVAQVALESNNNYINAWATQKREEEMPLAEINKFVDFMKADPVATHIMATTGELPPEGYDRQPFYEQKYQDEFLASPNRVPVETKQEILDDAREEISQTPTLDKVKPTPAVPVEVETDAPLSEDQILRGDASSMTTPQVDQAIDQLREMRSQLISHRPNSAEAMVAMSQLTKAERELVRRLDSRIEALKEATPNLLTRMVDGFFTTQQEQKERRERARSGRDQAAGEFLKALPKVN